MKLSTGSGDNVGRISARRAWIPLKKGKTEWMMHEIAVGCVNVTKPISGLGIGPVPVRGSAPTGLRVPARAVLALLLAVVDERTGCIPTWVVQTGGCGCMTEIADSRCSVCNVQVRASSKIRRRSELFESWRRLQQGTWTLY